MVPARDQRPLGVDFRSLHWLAMYASTRVVRQVSMPDLDRPTPCDGWSVRDLLRHMVGHNRGFAAELDGRRPDPGIWDGLDLGLDPRPHWEDSARRVVAAFAARVSLTGEISVADVGAVTVAQAVRMHAIDFLAHAWDVGAAIGRKPALDESACEDVLHIASSWPPEHPAIWGPGAPFGHPVAVATDAPASERMLGVLGRSPSWPDDGP